MRLMHKIAELSAPIEDMISIYVSYIRSILEQSCTVWHSSQVLERVQKSAMRIILKDQYHSYDQALETLMLAKLSERHDKLCIKFAKQYAENPLTCNLFLLNEAEGLETRNQDK